MHTITLTIDADANVRVAVQGLAGPSCKQATAEIEKALGKVTSDEKTAEFHWVPKVGQAVKQR